MPSTLALVPLRSPGEGKTRLASVLSVTARAELAGAMLADVTRALRVAGLERLVVVASGPAAAAAAAALGVDVITDAPEIRTLDDAILTAVARLGPADELLVTMADLPCLTAADVSALLATTAPIGLAPTTDGGTGGLIRRPAQVMDTAYGPASAARHVDLARQRGIEVEVVHRTGFSRDVDTAGDLQALAGWTTGPATQRWIQRHPLPAQHHDRPPPGAVPIDVPPGAVPIDVPPGAVPIDVPPGAVPIDVPPVRDELSPRRRAPAPNAGRPDGAPGHA